MTGDSITVLRARGRRLAKRVQADGQIVGYDDARTYDLMSRPIPDLRALGHLLGQLLTRPDCAVVRGGIIDPTRARGVRRLLHPDPETGETPTLEEVPRSWLALDLDGLDRPSDVPATDLAACANVAIAHLPSAFRTATFIVQASASHGLKPGLRLRLWFWLDRPLIGAEIKRWLAGYQVDQSIFRPVQVIYTAAPVFDRPSDDPLTRRMCIITGTADLVRVPSPGALAPPARPVSPVQPPDAAGSSAYANAALTYAATRVKRAGVGSRHDTILNEARNLARFVSAGLLTESAISRTLIEAGEQTGKPKDECAAIVTWAIGHPSTKPLQGGRAT